MVVASLRKARLRDDVQGGRTCQGCVLQKRTCADIFHNSSVQDVCLHVCFFLETSCGSTRYFVFLDFNVQNQRTAGSIDFDGTTIPPFPP